MADLRKICKAPLNLKIISFFHQHRSIVDTSSSIAAWLNHNLKEVQKVLDYLVSQNILICHRAGSTTAYAYTHDRQIIERIEKILTEGKDV